MSIIWNYKIDLVDKKIFSDIEKSRKIKIPEELKKLIEDGNAATPEKYKFMLGNVEKVFGAILSFNKGETDTDTVFTALEVIDNKELMPFAIDSFGNYICLNLESMDVVFWEHETGDIVSTEKDMETFMNDLY